MHDAELTRRDVFRGAGVIAGATALGGTVAAPSATAETTDTATIREGTHIAAHVSPDGRQVAFDLVTAIWTMPIAGGPARRLTTDDTDATQPSWSPDGRTLVFQAYRDGNYHLYTIKTDGTGLTQLTSGPFDHREPRFAPDGKTIAFSSDRGATGGYGIHILDVATGTITTRTDTVAEEGMPSWSPDGRRLVFTSDSTAIDVLDVATGTITRVVTAPTGAALYGPSLSPKGVLAYVRIVGATAELVVGDQVISGQGEDVFGFAPSWLSAEELLHTADGKLKRRRLNGAAVVVPFAAAVPVAPRPEYHRVVRDLDSTRERQALGIASPVASPDGTRVAFRALNALWLLKVGDPKPTSLVADGYFNSDPDFTPDGQSIVYASDRAGNADLWQRNLATGEERRLSGLPGAQLAPRVSPDGGRIAYTDHDGATWVLDLATGTPTQVTPPLFMPGRATWSPDGHTLALAAVKPYSRRFREGTSQVLTVDLETLALTYTEPLPHASIATRGDDGPVWSPDGAHLAFVVESCAWVVPVDARGRFTGPARQVTHEVTDSLSWQGADRLLYLHNGTLRSTRLGGKPRDIPLSLRWRPTQVRQHDVIRAGAIWDGTAERLRESVDIIVSDGKITDVLPAGGRKSTVDARTLTVMPGLIDAHIHWHLRGRAWGDRQGRA